MLMPEREREPGEVSAADETAPHTSPPSAEPPPEPPTAAPAAAPAPQPARSVSRQLLLWVLAIAAWLVPGVGHFLLGRRGRAAVYFLAVAALAMTGLALRGHIFEPTLRDPFDLLGFLANVGAGAFYFLARMVDNGGPDVSRAAGDYGTRFFATAGVLNLLCVLDALEITARKKP
jgi:hypothetical protein